MTKSGHEDAKARSKAATKGFRHERTKSTKRVDNPALVTAYLMAAAMLGVSIPLAAHNGPPYPLLTDRAAGNYIISLWADPDASDDGSADARFWVMVHPAAKGTPLSSDTSVQVTIWPANHPEMTRTQAAEPDPREPARRAAAFVIDHEGRYAVKATIAGPLGPAEIETVVESTYDARPRPALIAVFVLPFVLIGFVWLKLIVRRRKTFQPKTNVTAS